MRILIIKLGSIGDIVHALPAVAAIKRSIPYAEISWVAERRSAEIIRGCKIIDQLVEIDTRSLRGKGIDEGLAEISKQIKRLRKQKFDISIDMQGLLKSALIGQLAGAERRWGFGKSSLREPAARFMLTDTVDPDPDIHVIEKNRRLAEAALGTKLDGLDFPIASSAADEAEAISIVSRAAPKFAVLNPAGGWVTKLWPAERFGELADRLWEQHGLHSIVTTGPNETELADRVLTSSRSGKVHLETPSLKGFFELVKLAAVYVGGDTGPTHIAVAAGAPIVGLFGPTEWWRNGSPRSGDICVERTDIHCRLDCHRRKCDAWICLDIGVETVADAVARRLGTAAPARAYT